MNGFTVSVPDQAALGQAALSFSAPTSAPGFGPVFPGATGGGGFLPHPAATSIPASPSATTSTPAASAYSSRYSAGRYDAVSSESRLLEGWTVGLDAPEPPGAEYERGTLVARTRDLERNDPLAASAIEKRIDNVIGHGWSLTSKPNHKALGIEVEAAFDLAEQIECGWELYVKDPFFRFLQEENMTFAQTLALAYRTFYRDGEIFALLTFDDEDGHLPTGTRIQLIDPDRVSNPNGRADTETLKRGIEIDETGRPIAVHIRQGHPNDWTVMGRRTHWVRIPIRSETGRPNLLHTKQISRAGQLRGISRLAPVIKSLRAANVFDDAELQSKVANAVIAGFITSNYDVTTAASAVTAEEMLAIDKARIEYYQNNPGSTKAPLGGRFPVLPAGDTLTALDTKRDTGEDFVNRVLHNIAAGAGLSFEQLTMNMSQVNYSSIRAGLMEVHKNIARDQKHFADSFLGGWLYAWLEEQFARETITPPEGAPEFHAAPAAYCDVEWIYPALGWVDPVKEAQAAGIRMNLQLSTLEDEAAAQGRHWKKNLLQLARERRTRKELGLPVMDYAKAMSTNAREDKSGQPDHADPRENTDHSEPPAEQQEETANA